MDKEKQLRIAIIAIAALLLLNLMSTCSLNSSQKAATKRLNRLDTVVINLERRPTPLTEIQVRDAVRDECMESMYKYLIYETDLDKGKTSLSQIRSDIDRVKSGK